MNSSKIIGAIEIGTSKVVVLVGESAAHGKLRIIGKGECASAGVAKGEITDFKLASECVHRAIVEAEQMANAKIEHVFIAQTGKHLESFYNQSTVTVMSSDNIVRRTDVERAEKDAKSKELPQNRLYIHHIRNPFLLDDRVVLGPVGMGGKKLQVGYWCVTGDKNKIRDHVGIIGGFGMRVDDMIISSLASGVMVASADEKKSGVIVLDIGSGTTDYAVYRDGFVVYCGVVPVGGDHLTNDLSLGLRINRKNAESLKVELDKAFIDKSEAENRIWMIGDKGIGERNIPVQSIVKIINARMEELFNIVLKQVNVHVPVRELSAGAILTGGSSRLYGIEQSAADVFGIEVRRGQHPEWISKDIEGPEYSTALGLFHYALTAQESNSERDDGAQKQKSAGFIKKILNFKL